MDVDLEKEKLRKSLLAQLKKQTSELRQKRSELIIEKLKRRSEFRKSIGTMFYIATPHEVDTKPLILEALGEGSKVIVPYVNRKTDSLMPIQMHDFGRDLSPGSYGILEPQPDLVGPFDLNHLDLVLVPGIAFDRRGHRLGRGKGYYDRFLKTLPPHVKCFGLAFDFQIVKSVPTDEFDMSVDRIITIG